MRSRRDIRTPIHKRIRELRGKTRRRPAYNQENAPSAGPNSRAPEAVADGVTLKTGLLEQIRTIAMHTVHITYEHQLEERLKRTHNFEMLESIAVSCADHMPRTEMMRAVTTCYTCIVTLAEILPEDSSQVCSLCARYNEVAGEYGRGAARITPGHSSLLSLDPQEDLQSHLGSIERNERVAAAAARRRRDMGYPWPAGVADVPNPPRNPYPPELTYVRNPLHNMAAPPPRNPYPPELDYVPNPLRSLFRARRSAVIPEAPGGEAPSLMDARCADCINSGRVEARGCAACDDAALGHSRSLQEFEDEFEEEFELELEEEEEEEEEPRTPVRRPPQVLWSSPVQGACMLREMRPVQQQQQQLTVREQVMRHIVENAVTMEPRGSIELEVEGELQENAPRHAVNKQRKVQYEKRPLLQRQESDYFLDSSSEAPLNYGLCIVCEDAPMDCAMSCGHVCTCFRDGAKLSRCPICRQPGQAFRLFFCK